MILKLKPCPFCGSSNIKDHEKKQGAYHSCYIQCHRCNARTGVYSGHLSEPYSVLRSEATDAWNRRSNNNERINDDDINQTIHK